MESCTNSALPVLLGLARFGDLHQGEIHPAHELAQVVNVNAAVAQPARDHRVIDGAADGASGLIVTAVAGVQGGVFAAQDVLRHLQKTIQLAVANLLG